MTVEDAVERVPVSESTLRKWVREGALPYRRPKNRLLFTLPEIKKLAEQLGYKRRNSNQSE